MLQEVYKSLEGFCKFCENECSKYRSLLSAVNKFVLLTFHIYFPLGVKFYWACKRSVNIAVDIL